MNWTLIYLGGVLATLALAYLSGRTGLKSLAWLLGLSWAVCNAISVMCAPPIRIALYALVDCLWLGLILQVTSVSSSVRWQRAPLGGLYITGLCFHLSVFIDPKPDMRLYYTALNVIFALELVSVATAGGRISAQRYLRDHRDRRLHMGGVHAGKGAR